MEPGNGLGALRWARAVIIGLVCVVVVCGITYYNDIVLRQTYLVGNNMPIIVYGGLILCLLLLNPLLNLIRKRLSFSGPELALIIAMTLVACCIPGSGLMRTFNSSIMLPNHWVKTESGWKDNKVLEMVPEQMLVNVKQDEDRILTKYLQGMKQANKWVGFQEVPWYAWVRPWLFWLPLILCLWLALLGLALVVHPQWSANEQLQYPIASVTDALLPHGGSATGSVFKNRLFWVAGGIVFAIHTNNFMAQWFPRYIIPVPLNFDFSGFYELFPRFHGGLWWIEWPTMYFSVIGIAYFLASDVSLALGVGPLLYGIIAITLAGYGISLSSGGYFEANPEKMLSFGAYLGAACVLFYTGRHHYGTVFRRAFLLKHGETPAASYSVTGARLFIAATILLIALLMRGGLDLPLAVMFALATLLMFLVMGRIIAETGVFFIQSYWMAGPVIIALLGSRAMGPETVLMLLMLSAVLMVDPREGIMPFAVNALKLADMRSLRLGRVIILCVLAVIVGLAVAIPATTYLQYNFGVPWHDGWSTSFVAKAPFEETIRQAQRLEAQGLLDQARELSGISRFSAISMPKPAFFWAFVGGFGAFVLFALGRLRFAKWPLHPVMFLVWVTWPARIFEFSFILGWLLKSAVMKYGGARVYQMLKPMMIGLIAGEILGGIVPIIISFVFNLMGWTDFAPPKFGILPG